MVAALVTALGAVIVAFVALLGTRVESRDARTRLTKDVDLMLKLDPDNDARATLERHIADSAERLARAEKRRWRFRRSWRFFLLGTICGALGMSIKITLGGNDGSPGEYLRHLGPATSNALMVYSYATFGLCLFFSFRDTREPKTNPASEDKAAPPNGA